MIIFFAYSSTKVVYYMNEMSAINLHITLTKQTHWLESSYKSNKHHTQSK